MTHTFDAIVIGGGPAGAASARRLADAGWGVALIEQGRRHRGKTCGGCLSGRAVAALHDPGLADEVGALATAAPSRLRVHVGDDDIVPVALGSDPRSLAVARERFDQLLIDHAATRGVTVVQPALARVRATVEGRTEVRVRHHDAVVTLRAPLLVGADGLGSRVARAAGLSARRGRRRPAYGMAFEVDSGVAGAFERDAIEMFVGARGYVGAVRTGACSLHLAALVRDGERPEEFLGRMGDRFTRLRRLGLRPSGRGVGPMPWRPRAVADHRVALVGDAAGYVEPFTGEGIHWALRSAEALAEAVDGAPAGTWDARRAAAYRRAWRARIASGHRWCAAVAMLLRHPAWCHAIVGLLRSDGGLAQRVADRVVTA